VSQQCLFGGKEVGSKNCCLVQVVNKNRETLQPLIFKNIELGSIITSDFWPAYGDLNTLVYIHLNVNHSVSFVDPETNATTNHVENMRQKFRQSHKIRCGTQITVLDSYIFKFMWRQKHRNSFGKFVTHIKQLYDFNN
jgi:hypothetical protein